MSSEELIARLREVGDQLAGITGRAALHHAADALEKAEDENARLRGIIDRAEARLRRGVPLGEHMARHLMGMSSDTLFILSEADASDGPRVKVEP